MSQLVKKRVDGLDILKCIAAFLIICIHAPFFGEFGKYVTAIARIGVPIFLMITGYFYTSTINKNREKTQIKKILSLTLGANILFFVFNICLSIFKGTLSQYLAECFSFKSILSFLLLNDSPFCYHLWYLGALLYTLLIVALLRKFVKCWEKILYIITPLLLAVDLIFGKYSIVIFGYEPIPYKFLRNFLFVGIPYFTIGLYISRHQQLFSSLKKRTIILCIASVLFTATTILERFVLVSLNVNATRDHYFSSTLLALVLFILFENTAWNDRELGFLKKIGREYSLLIYIIHPITIPLIRGGLGKIGMISIYDYTAPFLVFSVSLAFSALYYYIKNTIKARRAKSNIIN